MGKTPKNKVYGVIKRKRTAYADSLIRAREAKATKNARMSPLTEQASTSFDNNYTNEDDTGAKEINFRIEENIDTNDDVGNKEMDLSLERCDKDNYFEPINIEGRRVVDFQYVFDQMIEISNHNMTFGCQLHSIKLVKERKNGLFSKYELNCSMCGSKFQLKTTREEENISDVNHSAVSGIILIGCGLSNFNELATSLDMPILNKNLYSKCHSNLFNWWKITAESTMKDAAVEESDKAIHKSSTGKPMIAVTADACWSKRSYKSNYSSLAGVGAIIGLNSGKVLHIGIKNKYCVVCMRAKNKENVTPQHNCNINHIGSSTSMEQATIVEGFKKSEEEHNLIYSQLIADGDASTYKNIIESRPYSNVTVQKIECSNHLLRNFNGKNMNLAKDTSIPLNQRKFLTNDRINRLRVAVKTATRFRKAQNIPFNEAVKKLRDDILNTPKHVFGDHTNCDNYYCSPEKTLECNNVPNVSALMIKLMANATALSNHSLSLLHNLNNNRAEQFNSLVAKYVGGKRVNYALKDSYALRCYVAVVAFNTGTPIYALHKTILQRSPSRKIKAFEMSKRSKNTKKKTWRPKRRLNLLSENRDYGESCQKPDMTDEAYSVAKVMYLENFKYQVQEIENIERDTVLQAESALWLELRRCLVTASNFGKICKRRRNISSAPLVKAMLYSYSLDHVSAIQHGKKYEAAALEQLARQEKLVLKKCGLFIDRQHFFLGATPDAVFDNGIVEIKCPKSAYGIKVEDAIKAKKINMWRMENNTTVLNKKCDWYYQVQSKTECVFGVWTGSEHLIKTEIIRRDDEFWTREMEAKLINFYQKCLLPEIVDSRKARSMPLRSTSF